MDGRLREATTVEISTALGKLFRALPPRKASPAELEESYLIACHKTTKHAIETVVVKLIRGELEGLSKSFAPSPAEIASAIRDEMVWVQKQVNIAAERSMIADNRPLAVKPMLFQERAEQARQKMWDEGRKLLFVVANIDQLKSRSRELPVGFGYIATTGEVWGAPGSISSSDAHPEPERLPEPEAPAPMAETLNDDIPW